MGKVIFILTVRADIPQDERDAIVKYKLGDCMLYQREPNPVEPSMGGIAKATFKHMMNLTVKAKELVDGKTIECKDILEMLAVEEQLKQAGNTFSYMLHAAMNFGGEEVVEV
jgi:hypothetical protein